MNGLPRHVSYRSRKVVSRGARLIAKGARSRMRKRKKSNSQLVFQCGFPLRIPRMYRTEIRGYLYVLYDLYLADVTAALIRNGNEFQKRSAAGPRRFDRRLCNLVPRDDSSSSSSRYLPFHACSPFAFHACSPPRRVLRHDKAKRELPTLAVVRTLSGETPEERALRNCAICAKTKLICLTSPIYC